VPEKCNFGFDVIVFVGKSLFLQCRNYQEILLELKQKNVTISINEIAFLDKKFVIYLALLHGDLSNIKMIEKGVKKFRDRLCKDKKYSENPDYQKMVEQINKYWEKLFAYPIIVEKKAGRIVIQPQRTNNMEQFFRKLMRIFRKRNGFNTMEKIIKAMVADTPFVMNLENNDYIHILLDGKETLEERFAEIYAKKVREEIEKSRSEGSMISPKIKKIIRMPELPKSIVSLLSRKAS